jgi:hypothetical protein
MRGFLRPRDTLSIFERKVTYMNKKLIILAIVLAAVLILPVGTKACLVNFSITVSADNGESKTDQIFTGSGSTDADGRFVWDLGDEVPILDGFIENLKLTMKADPEVGIEFGLRAGSLTTNYSILSYVVSFGSMVNPTAYASAGVTLTDRITASGAAITGLLPEGKTHQARYNGSSVFANLVDGFAIPSGTVTHSEENGNEFNMITINDTLTSIESEFYFTLTARDSASGTSTFVVVPEPATIGLLGLGTLSLLRSRKRKV